MRRPFILSAVIGIAVITISLILIMTSPRQTGKLAEGFFSPVIAFEFARSVEDIRLIFFDNNGQLIQEAVETITLGTQLDFLFMIFYGLFLLTFSLSCLSLTGNRLFYLAAALSILAPIFDLFENLQLLSIMAQLNGEELIQELQRLHLFTWLKWGSLSLVFLILIPFFQDKGILGRIMTLFAAIPFGLAIIAYFLPGFLSEIFALSVSAMFLLMIYFSFRYKTALTNTS